MLTYTDAHTQYPLHYPTHHPYLLSLPPFSPPPLVLLHLSLLLFTSPLPSSSSSSHSSFSHFSPPLPSFSSSTHSSLLSSSPFSSPFLIFLLFICHRDEKTGRDVPFEFGYVQNIIHCLTLKIHSFQYSSSYIKIGIVFF